MYPYIVVDRWFVGIDALAVLIVTYFYIDALYVGIFPKSSIIAILILLYLIVNF